MHRLKFLLGVFSMGLALTAGAQSLQVFEGNAHYLENLVLEVRSGRVLPPTTFDWSQAAYTVSENRIYAGGYENYNKIAFTVDDNMLYSGDSFLNADILYTFDQGRIYKGRSTYALDQVYNITDGVLYKGANQTEFDRLYYLRGGYSLAELYAVLLALELI